MTQQYGYWEVRFEIAVLRHSSLNRKDACIMSVLPKLRADTASPVPVSAKKAATVRDFRLLSRRSWELRYSVLLHSEQV